MSSLIVVLSLFILSCSHSPYPAHWWEKVDAKTKAWWEILPQEAKAGEVILSKRNELGLLSNFAHTPFIFEGESYQSIEGFWQMMLYPENKNDPRMNKRVNWKYTRKEVAQMTAFKAKSAGDLAEENMKILGIDWVSFKGERFLYRSPSPSRHYELIYAAMKAKCEQNPKVKKVLLQTGNLKLKPDHLEEKKAPQEWRYYELWEKIRNEIR